VVASSEGGGGEARRGRGVAGGRMAAAAAAADSWCGCDECGAVFEKNAGICGSVGVVCPWSWLAFIYYDVRTVIYLSSNRLQSTSSVPECAPKVVYVST
jgi:hypothetical protein